MTEKNDYKGLLGLAQRAGRVKSGEFQTEESVKTLRAKLCIIASDASETTKKHIKDICNYRAIRVIEDNITKAELGHSIGRDERASITVEDEGFAKHILEKIEGGNACGK